jgi:protein-S-isoprenylcysteine O-methyltransferase Ste14
MNIYLYLILNSSAILFGFLVFRVFVRKDYEHKGGLSKLSTTLEFLIFALHANLCYTFLPVRWPLLPALPENKFQLGFGFGLMAVGLLLMLWAMSGLGFKKAIGHDQKEGLKRSGFYQRVRNPQIIFYGLLLVGLATLWPSLYALGWLLVYAAIAHMMVRTEEEHLLRIFGDEYREYCEETGRYFPLTRRWICS